MSLYCEISIIVFVFSLLLLQPFNISPVSFACNFQDWGWVILREIDFLLKICWSIPCLHPSWKVPTLAPVWQFITATLTCFSVADKVVVTSKNNGDPKQHIWESDSESFSVVEDPRGVTLGRGTTVSLYLKEEASDYLELNTIRELVRCSTLLFAVNSCSWYCAKFLRSLKIIEKGLVIFQPANTRKKNFRLLLVIFWHAFS